MSPTRTTCACIGLLGMSMSVHAEVFYVNAAAPPGGDGQSWATASHLLRATLLDATAGDEVWVAAGRYTAIDTSPVLGGIGAFPVNEGVTLYGGFAGTESDPSERDISANITTLTGDVLGNDGPNGENRFENSTHVIFAYNNSVIDGVTIADGNAELENDHLWGGGVYASDVSTVIRNCTFAHNYAFLAGAAIAGINGADITVSNCVFFENSGGTGIIYAFGGCLDIRDSDFISNMGEFAGGGIVADGLFFTAVNCRMIDNRGVLSGGAIVDASDDSLVVNCAFSENETALDGATVEKVEGSGVYVNCTIANSIGHGLKVISEAPVEVYNSIVWGSTAPAILHDQSGPLGVFYSDIQNGWTGTGSNNIDANPLFVQPGVHDLRLSLGSPCVDAGWNGAIPDGIDVDVLGNPRIVDGIVDMGAYEGAVAPLPPADTVGDLDQGEAAVLIPDGNTFNTFEHAAVIIANLTGPDNATATLTQYPTNLHPGASGACPSMTQLDLVTTLTDGQFSNRVSIPFGPEDLHGIDPTTLDLTSFDADLDTWVVAPTLNVGAPIGQRFVHVSEVIPPLSPALGDYGIVWNPTLERGYVWANLDHQSQYAFGVLTDCPEDTDRSNTIDIEDMITVLEAWGDTGGPADVNCDRNVSSLDLLQVFGAWGTCP